MIPTDGRSTPRTPVVPAVPCEAPDVSQAFVVRSTMQCCVGLLDRSDTRDTRDVGDSVYWGAPTPVLPSARETSAPITQRNQAVLIGRLNAGADALPEDLTLAEIAAILMGTQDQQCPSTPAECHAAQQIAGLAYRVKECPRCAPRADRPPHGTTSTSCPRHLILDQVDILSHTLTTRPSSSTVAAYRRDEERLGRLLVAVACADDWSGADWALAARTLDDATAPVALLRDAPVIQYALTVCRKAGVADVIGEGIAHDAR